MIVQEQQRKYANQHRRHIIFEIGNKVLLSSRNIQDPVGKNRPTQKLTPKYYGPFEVIAVISDTAYKLQLPHSWKIHLVFHVSLLKLYQTDDEFSRLVPPPLEIVNENQEDEYEVESILDKKMLRNKPYYLIKWKGYPLHDATWEPVTNLTNAMDIVNQFNDQ